MRALNTTMKIAVIGAGLAGLGAAYFLLEMGAEVTLFDAEGIAGGASGVCSGLLHPYPGLSARLSQQAEEALELGQQLLAVAEREVGRVLASREGILRQAISEDQKKRLKSYGDVEQLEENLFWVKRGLTVSCFDYLQALGASLQKRGVHFARERITDLHTLSAFDRILLACGYGVRKFFNLPIEFLKGQLLCYKGASPFPMSFIGKGYITKTEEGFEVGATYERNFSSEKPCLETAQKLLRTSEGTLLGIKAGIRVCPIGHYLPITVQLSDKLFVFTGLGSRGLLYHALFGKKVAQMMRNS